MRPIAIVAPAIGAIAGALVWAGISYYTEYEIGYVAWGIGALIGWLGGRVGGGGTNMGIYCGALALGSIFIGKVIAIQTSGEHWLDQFLNTGLTAAAYQESREDAAAFATTESSEWRTFMVTRGFTEAKSPDRVTDDELRRFEQNHAQNLRDIAANPPSYEEWKSREEERVRASFRSEFSPMQAAKENLGPIDILFALLGIVTAFQLGRGSREQHAGNPPPAAGQV